MAIPCILNHVLFNILFWEGMLLYIYIFFFFFLRRTPLIKATVEYPPKNNIISCAK